MFSMHEALGKNAFSKIPLKPNRSWWRQIASFNFYHACDF